LEAFSSDYTLEKIENDAYKMMELQGPSSSRIGPAKFTLFFVIELKLQYRQGPNGLKKKITECIYIGKEVVKLSVLYD